MADIKPEEISHPPMDQLQGFEYCIDSNPSWGEAIALGFQHYILSLGTAVMIPTLLIQAIDGTDDDKVRLVQTLLFVSGINTLLQTLFGTRLPTVIGGSFAFFVPIISIVHGSSIIKTPDPHERFLQTMRAIQGALIVSSSIQIILGYSQLWGICSRFFSPLGMVPVVALVGFGLFDRGFPVVGRCVEIGVPMLILFVAASQYLKYIHVRRVPILERFALLVSITLIWTYAHILTVGGAYKNRPERTQLNCRTDRANLISSAPWIKIPYPLQWGAPTFDAGHAFGMMAAVFVSLVESTAAYKAAARLASATPPPAHVLSRGIGWQGIGILLDGIFGTGTGSTVSVENVGLLGSTRVGSRRVVQISAGFMIFFSMLGSRGGVSKLSWEIRMKIALEAAKGLEYLHEQVNPPVIHRDFKSSNILLDRNFHAKVSDFGLAKLGSDKAGGHVSTRVLGTQGYVAPEYAMTGHLTTKSDVYSYGVVLLELLTGRVPVDMKRPHGEGVLVSWVLPWLTDREKVVQIMDPSLEGQYSVKDAVQVAAIAAMCVQPEADYRPLMADVVQSLVPLVKHKSTAKVGSFHTPPKSPKSPTTPDFGKAIS